MSIVAKNVVKMYGAQAALGGISIDIKRGEIVGFLGPNGAGKSTFMKILTGYIPMSGGSVEVCGLDVEENSLEVRKKVGYLPENNPLYHDLYVKEYLLFIAGLHKLDKKWKRVNDIVGRVGLDREQNKKIGELSKGYRQRVGLAQALIHDPEVLILDEPTSGLDPNQLEEIRALIRDAGREKTVMLSTHIMQEVEVVCERVIIINQGLIVANDMTQNLRHAISEQQILKVEFDRPFEVDTLKEIPEIETVKMTGDCTCLIYARANRDLRKEIFSFAVKNNLSVLTLQREEVGLQEVFKQVTSQK